MSLSVFADLYHMLNVYADSTLDDEQEVDQMKKPGVVPSDIRSKNDPPRPGESTQHQFNRRIPYHDTVWDQRASESGLKSALL